MTEINVNELYPADTIRDIYKKYPHVGRRLAERWGSEWFSKYVREISFMDRPDRDGFSFDVLMSLSALDELHRTFFNLYGNKVDFRKFLG